MSIVTKAQLEALRQVGRIVRLALAAMQDSLRPGVTTAELAAIAQGVFDRNGARSAPKLVYDFPGAVCISVNDEIVHGIPGPRSIEGGDVVKLDVVAEKGGFLADAAVTEIVPPVTADKQRLVECARSAFAKALDAARVGNRVNDIGRAIEDEVLRSGFSVVRELTGHGIGKTIHEQPTIPNFYDPRYDQPLTEGLVVAIEPIITAGAGSAIAASDGWTIRTVDGSMAAHHEQSLVISAAGPILLTAA
jgi:methionyl aminopeptidase